jgi:hypothetical protein
MLSGFVILHAYREKLGTIDGVRHFIWLRFWRLYPLHFTLLIVVLFVEIMRLVLEKRYGMIANHPVFVQNDTSAFLKNLFLIQGLYMPSSLSFNEPAWSISTEFCAYLAFAAVAFMWPTRIAIVLMSGLLCAISLTTLLALGPRGVPLNYDFGIIRCLFGFFFWCARLRPVRLGSRNTLSRQAPPIVWPHRCSFYDCACALFDEQEARLFGFAHLSTFHPGRSAGCPLARNQRNALPLLPPTSMACRNFLFSLHGAFYDSLVCERLLALRHPRIGCFASISR